MVRTVQAEAPEPELELAAAVEPAVVADLAVEEPEAALAREAEAALV